MIGPETPRNSSQSKKFQNVTIRRFIEFNSDSGSGPRRASSYMAIFRSRQGDSKSPSRHASKPRTPRRRKEAPRRKSFHMDFTNEFDPADLRGPEKKARFPKKVYKTVGSRREVKGGRAKGSSYGMMFEKKLEMEKEDETCFKKKSQREEYVEEKTRRRFSSSEEIDGEWDDGTEGSNWGTASEEDVEFPQREGPRKPRKKIKIRKTVE